MHVIQFLPFLFHCFLLIQTINVKNIGSTLLDVLQKFTRTIMWTNLHSTYIFVWFTNNENSELLSFYRKLRFHSAHSSCYLFEHTYPSTIINAINNIDSSEYLLQISRKNRIQANKTLHPCKIYRYKSQLNIICKHKMSKTKITMSSGRKGKNNAQPNTCGICLYRTCNAQFGVGIYTNQCVFHPINENKVKHYKEQNEMQKIKDVNLDKLKRVKKSPQLFFNSIYEKFDPRQTEVSCTHCYLNNRQVEYSFSTMFNIEIKEL